MPEVQAARANGGIGGDTGEFIEGDISWECVACGRWRADSVEAWRGAVGRGTVW